MLVYSSVLDWLDLKSGLVFLFGCLLLSSFLKNRNPPNFPPGPWSLPFLWKCFVSFDHQAIDKVAEQFGNVFSLRWGVDKVVFVSGYKMVKNVLVTQGDNFSDRPVTPIFNDIFKGYGISMSNGYKWRRQRQFSSAYLKHFVEVKKNLEQHTQLECHFLCEAFRKQMGGPFNPHSLIHNASANVIGSLVFGKRFEYDDTDFQNLLQLSQESILLAGTRLAKMYGVFPWLFRHLPGPHEIIFSNYAKLIFFLRKEIEKHKRDWDPFNHRDFIDSYVAEIDKRKKDTKAGFHSENLAFCTLDLFEAGTETVTSTLCWALVYMMKYSEVQAKVQEEIDLVIGQSRPPRMTDKINMPYTEAVIHETQRMANVVPLTAPRVASKDTTVGEYFIPQGTVLITNLSSVLHDQTEWETPERFNPQHFLDEHGHFRKREAFFPFSAGRRGCLGEQLARMELLLFFTSLLQRFTFSPALGEEPSSNVQGAAILSPKPFNICVTSRR